MTRTTSLGRRAAATALAVAGALTLGLVQAAPASAAPDPLFYAVDSVSGDSIVFGGLAGHSGSPVTYDMQVSRYDASADGSVVAVNAFSGTPSDPDRDIAGGLLVHKGGVTRLLTTYVDTNPVVSADGATVWFVTDGDLYSYATSGTTVTRITTSGQFTPPTGYDFLTRISISPSGGRIAAVYRNFDANDKVDKSVVKVTTVGASPTTLFTKTYTGAANAEAFDDSPAWLDEDDVAFGQCVDGSCDAWTWRKVDLTVPNGSESAFDGPNGLYDLRKLGSTWYAWKTTGTGVDTSTILWSSTDDAVTFSEIGTPRNDGASTFYYVPVTQKAAEFNGLTSVNPGVSDASLLLSAGKVSTGGSAVYFAGNFYLRPVGAQDPFNDADLVQRGTLSYSTDGKKTWKVLRTTTGATKVAFPGLPFPGNGRTQALTRNTWFRWSYTGNAFAASATSSAELVQVAPTITAKAKKKGSKKVVSGTVARTGGTIALYKGSKKLGKTSIKATGAFSFKALKLARGSYTLKTAGDASWAASSKKLKV
ncbi:MAG: hypothetical protein U0S36_05610 [Candidatus Nanopelagicales bacterium]